MSKVDVYAGEYLTIEEETKEESDRLSSAEAVIGMPVTFSPMQDQGGFRVLEKNGNSLGIVRPKNKLRIQEALENHWTYRAWLTLVYYDGKKKLYRGEVAYVLYNLKPDMTEQIKAFDGYIEGVAQAIRSGKRPKLSLTGTQYEEVLNSKGQWRATEQEPLPISTKRGSNTVVFKRKMSATDKLAAGVVEGRPGPIIFTVVVLVVIVVLIVFLIHSCVSGS